MGVAIPTQVHVDSSLADMKPLRGAGTRVRPSPGIRESIQPSKGHPQSAGSGPEQAEEGEASLPAVFSTSLRTDVSMVSPSQRPMAELAIAGPTAG